MREQYLTEVLTRSQFLKRVDLIGCILKLQKW